MVHGLRYSSAQVPSHGGIEPDCHPSEYVGQTLNTNTDGAGLRSGRACRVGRIFGQIEHPVGIANSDTCDTTKPFKIERVVGQNKRRQIERCQRTNGGVVDGRVLNDLGAQVSGMDDPEMALVVFG